MTEDGSRDTGGGGSGGGGTGPDTNGSDSKKKSPVIIIVVVLVVLGVMGLCVLMAVAVRRKRKAYEDRVSFPVLTCSSFDMLYYLSII